ncbi:hypothetical protein JTB14_037104 [Gonioctena quinquepunctata]|nr:hypothetical protein JTB14_037104 [Gonioctena quinquepunctata]
MRNDWPEQIFKKVQVATGNPLDLGNEEDWAIFDMTYTLIKKKRPEVVELLKETTPWSLEYTVDIKRSSKTGSTEKEKYVYEEETKWTILLPRETGRETEKGKLTEGHGINLRGTTEKGKGQNVQIEEKNVGIRSIQKNKRWDLLIQVKKGGANILKDEIINKAGINTRTKKPKNVYKVRHQKHR